MKTLRIHNTDLDVSALCLGTAKWCDGAGVEKLYAQFREAGGNCFDSAHCYAFWLDHLGDSERTLGRCVREFEATRDDVIVCTKGCHNHGGEKYPRPQDYLSPRVLASDIAESLERLQTHVDLYFLHRDDPRVPVAEIIDALDEHRRAGRIRHYAASNWTDERIAEANACATRRGRAPFVASQVQWNLAERTKPMPSDMRAMSESKRGWHAQTRLPVFAYSSSAGGYFAGRESRTYDTPASRARRGRAADLAKRVGAAPGQVALAYLMNQPFATIPIVGTHDPAHLADAIAATSVRLTEQQLDWLRDAPAS